MRTVVVSGASGGIGAAIVRLLLQRGDRVYAIGRSAENLATLNDGLVPRWSAYVGSKAALTELADALRAEELRAGVRVTSVYPGGTATELLKEVRSQFGGEFRAEDCIEPATVAQYVLLALMHPPTAT